MHDNSLHINHGVVFNRGISMQNISRGGGCPIVKTKAETIPKMFTCKSK